MDFRGEHLRVENARLTRVPDPVPEVYFGGSSSAAGEVAWIRRPAEAQGRTVRFGSHRGGRAGSGRTDRVARANDP